MTRGYGFSVEDIDWSCPADLEPYSKAKEVENKHTDNNLYIMGLYSKLAFEVVMSHFGAGLSGKQSHAKYIEKPLSEIAEERKYKEMQDRKEYKGLTEEEKQKSELNKAIDYFNSLKARF